MNPASSATPLSEFCRVAQAEGLLSPSQLDELVRACESSGVPPSQFVIERGWLDSITADVVETLMRRHDAVPQYTILRVLGRGGMGIVYLAQQNSLGRTVALKMVHLSQLTQPGAVGRFEREARTLAQLQHPNIVNIFDFGRASGRLYFAMEYVPGEDLASLLRRYGSLEEAAAWGLARQATAGLAHAARQGVVHRDVKPGNFLLVETPEGCSMARPLPLLKVTDFGLAADRSHTQAGQERLTMVGALVGTPNFMAPEQFEQTEADLRSDMYALGGTVYQMLTGLVPFGEMGILELLSKKSRGEIPDPCATRGDLSAPTVALLRRLMAYRADDRPGDYRTLLSEIDTLLATLPTATVVLSVPVKSVETSMPGLATHPSDVQTVPSLPVWDTAVTQAGPTPAAAPAAPRAGAPVPSVGASQAVRAGATGSAPSMSAASVEVSPTLAMPLAAVSQPRRALTRRTWMIGLGATAGLALATAGVWYGFGRPVEDDTEWVGAGAPEFLYDGQSLGRWQVQGGVWLPSRDAEGGRILSGNGSIRRPLPEAQRAQNYRIELLVSLEKAHAIDIQFGIEQGPEETSRRRLLRANAEGVQLGTQYGARDSMQPRGGVVKWKGPATSTETPLYHTLQIQRTGTTWRAIVDDEPVGTLPASPATELPEFRLNVWSGPALFDQILFEPLKPAVVTGSRKP